LKTAWLNAVTQRYLGVPHFQVFLKREWASDAAEARKLLRQHLFENIEGQAAILDLETIPCLQQGKVSISHCKKLGGFSFDPAGASIGFDIELTERVRSDSIRIVCVSRDEKERAPNAAALWTAKEAAFKALQGPKQPRGVADIEIGAWVEREAGFFCCEMLSLQGRPAPANRGLVLEFHESDTAITVGFFVLGGVKSEMAAH